MRTLTTLTGNSQKLDGGAMFGNDVQERSLDARFLHVDVEVHVREGLQDLRKKRHGFTRVAVTQRGQFPPRHVVDRAGAVVATIHGFVVADHDCAVRAQVRVGFDVAKPGRVGVGEGGHRVLRGLLAAATVGEDDGSLTHGHGHHEHGSCPR